ncbi:MAG TPA: hypothetical protein VNB49_16245 [Candidatus Dormibacteraeota bacterium]|nr:hypothetical protein [Candidatus Dormibacteraeota bacterium]
MLTIFPTGKPFRGHCGVIQRNALKSWTMLHPDVEVILFGDDEGAAEAASELGIKHFPHVDRHESGMKYLRSIFDPAQELARHPILCYVNCDIVLTSDFRTAIERLQALHSKFVMIGRRWDIDAQVPLPFDVPDWEDNLRRVALSRGNQRPANWIDYFVFPRGLYSRQLPDFLIGRVYWDNWLVWRARKSGWPVVDASEVVVAIHQNHDYGYHPSGAAGVWSDQLAQRNLILAGGKFHTCTIEDATHCLGPGGERRTASHVFRPVYRLQRTAREVTWLALLDWTRPVRKGLGLRQKTLRTVVALWRRIVPKG